MIRGNMTNTSSTLAELEPAAHALGLQVQFFNASTSREIDAAFAATMLGRPDALFVAPDGFFTAGVHPAALAARHALPATDLVRDFVEVGGLTSYGANLANAIGKSDFMRAAFLGARSPETFRSRNRPSSS